MSNSSSYLPMNLSDTRFILHVVVVLLFTTPCPAQQLNGEMMVESLQESQKINPEPDKALVVVRSEIPNLRFDSNRSILRVNQVSSGTWQVWLPAGTHILKIRADGYEQLDLDARNYGNGRAFELRIKELKAPRKAPPVLKSRTVTLSNSNLGGSVPQVIQNITSWIQGENTIVVQYDLSPARESQSYQVELYFSFNGGRSYVSPASVRGDVGAVSGGGSKRIVWRALDEELMENGYCQIRLVVNETETVGDFLRNVISGSDEVRAFVNKFMLQASYHRMDFISSPYREAVSNHVIKRDLGLAGGITYTSLPVFIDVRYSWQMYLIDSGSSEKDTVSHHGVAVAVGLSILPVSKYVVPFAGFGYQESTLRLKSDMQANTSSLFWMGALHINFTSSLSLVGEYRRGWGAGNRMWHQIFISAGIGWGWLKGSS